MKCLQAKSFNRYEKSFHRGQSSIRPYRNPRERFGQFSKTLEMA